MLRTLDSDGNGTIDKDEFRHWLNGFDGDTDDDDPIAHARAALLRAKLSGRQMERRLRVASAKAKDVVAPAADASLSTLAFKFSAGNDDDIKLRLTLALDHPTEEDLAALGGGAKITLSVACKEGTTPLQHGKFVGRIQTLYDMAMDKLGPMIAQFGALTIEPIEEPTMGVRLVFVSPNNAVQMNVPVEALPMDPSTLLESFVASIGVGYDFMDMVAGGDHLEAAFKRAMSVSLKGQLNKAALRHAKDIVKVMGLPEQASMGIGALANLILASTSVEFESFEDLLNLHPAAEQWAQDLIQSLAKSQGAKDKAASKFSDLEQLACPMLNMDVAQFHAFYQDLQSVCGSLTEVSATTALGLRATMSYEGLDPVSAMCPSLAEIDE